MSTVYPSYPGVHSSVENAPVVGVVRTHEFSTAERQANLFIEGGLELVEITFTVPEAPRLVRRLLERRGGDGPPWIGMGTITTPERARQALDAGVEFAITPNADPEVAAVLKAAGVFLCVGALTPTEIVSARNMGADLVKVYPLPPVGGPDYLRVVRGPLGDIPMLAAGGFGVEDIPAYREAGAVAFGIGPQLLGADDAETHALIRRGLALARGGDDRGNGNGGDE